MDLPDANRWERVQDLLGRALELEGAERTAYLDEACAANSDLREEVESLLAASGASDAYFDDLADRAGITLSGDTLSGRPYARDDSVMDLLGKRVGQYQVLGRLGEGGMAVVYLAEREGDGFTQRVALKLVSRRLEDPEVQRRSNEERRILARLEHRNIARLIDGGVTADGYPFYAMEYVEGTDVLSHCDAQRLGVGGRLRLFLEVCAPVQFAHERLVIHCDLKPSNIFVTGQGHVKLLDFGVARLIDPEAEGSGTTGLWFTPAYASPEQVRREPPGTHSDVYSLGVLLYEILTGHRPYRFDSPAQDDIVRTVGEVVPPLPSSVVTQPATRTVDGARAEVAPEAVSSARGLTPGGMKKRLRGDLDAIVMKALAKDPSARYHTAEQLAADIRRHLDHRPVASVAQTPAYSMSRFARRNRGALAAAGVVLVALLGGLGATLWQASRATAAARSAEDEAQKAAMVAELMGDLFRLSDPSEALGDTITARDLLDRGAERIRSEFGDQPVVQAELLSEVARVYNNLGLYARAEPLILLARDLRIENFGAESLEATESLVQLGVLKSSLSDPNQAIEILESAIPVRERLFDGPDAVTVEAKAALAWAVRGAGEYDRAARLFTEALDAQRSLDPGAFELADLMFGLASSYHDSGMLDEADSVFRVVLSDVDMSARPTPNAVSALRTVGMVRRLREQYAEADPLLRGGVDMATRLYGPEHGSVLMIQLEYGLNLNGLGRWSESEPLFRQTADLSARLLGPTHNVTARLQEGLAVTLEYLGRYDEATEYQALSLREKVLRHEGRDHPGVVASLVAIGRTLALAGRHAEARDYFDQSQSMNLRLGATRSVYTIASERSLGIMAAAEGDFEIAEAHFLRAISLAEQLLSRPSHRFLVGARSEYAAALVEAGRTEEAIPIFEDVLRLQRESLVASHPFISRTQDHLAEARAR